MDNGVAFPVMDACAPVTAAVLEPRVHARRLRSGARSRMCHFVQYVTVNSSIFSVLRRFGSFRRPTVVGCRGLRGAGVAASCTPR